MGVICRDFSLKKGQCDSRREDRENMCGGRRKKKKRMVPFVDSTVMDFQAESLMVGMGRTW